MAPMFAASQLYQSRFSHTQTLSFWLPRTRGTSQPLPAMVNNTVQPLDPGFGIGGRSPEESTGGNSICASPQHILTPGKALDFKQHIFKSRAQSVVDARGRKYA